jgi:hypothetical protein
MLSSSVCSSSPAAGGALAKLAGVLSNGVTVPVLVASGADALTAIAAQSQRVPVTAPQAVSWRAAPAQQLLISGRTAQERGSRGAPIHRMACPIKVRDFR